MTSVTSRWWFEEPKLSELNSKIATNHWYVRLSNGDIGKVVKIAYVGFKVEFPDGESKLINLVGSVPPADLEESDYNGLVPLWLENKRRQDQEIADRNAAAEAERVAFLEFQRSCPHNKVLTHEVCRAAGCDINDTYCITCSKILQRSWSTAYDRDPDDHISDWAWWVGRCLELYQQEPKLADYKVVDVISPM